MKKREEGDKACEVIRGNRSRDRAKVCVFRGMGAKENDRPRARRAPGETPVKSYPILSYPILSYIIKNTGSRA